MEQNTKELGFGLMRLPLTDPNDGASVDVELLKTMVDAFLEKGGDGETCLRLKTGKVGRAVVDGYQEVEATVVGAYKKIEEAFVDAFLEKADANGSPTPAHLSEAAESTPGGSETHGAPDAGRTDA